MTFLELKNLFGRFIGESDGSATDSARDALINDSLKEVSSRYPFLCNKKSTTITTTAGVGTLPTDIDYSHLNEISVYTYSGADKTTYTLVSFDDVSAHDTSEYVFAIDQENSQIKSNQNTTLTFDYYATPADLVNPTDKTTFPIPQCIARYGAGQYWQSIEEEPDQAKMNLAVADNLFSRAVYQDQKSKGSDTIENFLSGRDLGF